MNAISTYLSVQWLRCVSIFFLGSFLYPMPAMADDACADVVVYGGTPAGIMAAVAAARHGQTVLLVEPGYFVGGMMAGGLTKTDIGNKKTVGGLPMEFFTKVQSYYEKTYGSDSAQAHDCKGGLYFEPKVAAQVFEKLLSDAGVRVLKKERLQSVAHDKEHISSITVQNYETKEVGTIPGKVFIDASYEGDLMAGAAVPYHVGRESSAEYGESLAGVNAGPEEGLGKGDAHVQSYNIRSTLTTRDDIRVPIPKPDNYDPAPFKSFLDAVNKRNLKTFEDLFHDTSQWGPINGKSDPNKADGVGLNDEYPEGNYEVRQKIYERIRDRWLSFWYMLQNDPSLSEEFRTSAKRWGLPGDEFMDSGHVTPQLYVREGRRMTGAYVLNQNDLLVNRHKPDTICLGSYTIDCHPIQILSMPDGKEVEEGHLGTKVKPYEIPYRSLTPVKPDNLLVVCAVSATHVAYCSLRMEPVFMMMGQAGGIAAALSQEGKVPVQGISIDQLHDELNKVGIPLQAPK